MGMAYPLEMHIVHQNENGDLGVIGVLFTTEDVPDSDEAVAPLWKKVDATEGTIKANLNNFVNPESGFFSWQGSLTTPPCTEGLQWVLQKETVPISPAARNAFWNYIGGFPGSARPTMPLNGRIVTANGFPTPASRHPRLHTPHCFLRPLATTCNLAPGTCNLQPAICNLQPAPCTLQPRTTCTGAGSPSSGFATTSWQECLLFFCTLLLHGVL